MPDLIRLCVQRFAGWLAQICDENSRMHGTLNSKSPPRVCTCADFHREFVPANLQTSVLRSEWPLPFFLVARQASKYAKPPTHICTIHVHTHDTRTYAQGWIQGGGGGQPSSPNPENQFENGACVKG